MLGRFRPTPLALGHPRKKLNVGGKGGPPPATNYNQEISGKISKLPKFSRFRPGTFNLATRSCHRCELLHSR